MPSYAYVCPKCKHSEVIFHSMTATVHLFCDNCLEEKVRKPQATAVTFNGGGWASKE